ncbi:hypothetical protein ARMSODRAFT_958725 [Armillaria solidipes]|uniref:Uncharacterized protein n=1 Tax=Armillaria solidipes TaxID=1076256 RepID=A0A2H3BA32_9AGAR|nr:hypothetical protein ARMSODRAFT_958725 [Armillaria solidipes]
MHPIEPTIRSDLPPAILVNMSGAVIKVTFNSAVRQAKTSFKKTSEKNLLPKLNEIVEKVIHNISSAEPGTRCWPSGTQSDAKIGIRLDWGDFQKDTDGTKISRNLNLQVNTNAKDKTFRELAKGKGSHKKRVLITIPVTAAGEATDTAKEQMRETFNDSLIQEAMDGGI